jgi:hypothetical protein
MIAEPDVANGNIRCAAVEQQPSLRAVSETARPNGRAQEQVDEMLYLTGRPTLKDFVRFTENQALNRPDEGILAEEWQAAAKVIQGLETEEASAADNPAILKLGPEYEPLLIEFLKDPLVRGGFNCVPSEVAFVELDRLIVYQKHIDLTFTHDLASRLGPAPTYEQVFRTCLPFDHPQPPAKWCRVHHNKFAFVSASNDLRFLDAMELGPRNITDYPPPGDVLGILGLAVGFGSNFMNAVYADKRLILNNGSHRAYVLRKLGLTYAPCIVQHVSSREELELVASSDVRHNPDLFLTHPRPPILRDYFNPKIHKVMPVSRRLRQVTISFEIDEGYVPSL